jgi:hypothetical protein
MKKLAIMLIIALTAIGCEKTTHVILMAGQSNMVGYGKIAELQNAQLPENITYYNFGRQLGKPASSPDHFGPELGISQVLSENFINEKFIIIKYATGGASLLDWAKDYDSLTASTTGNPKNFGKMYDSLLKKTNEILKGKKHKKLALIWMQGERDARIPEAGDQYYDNYLKFIANLRQDTDSPNLPILFGKVNPPSDRYPALEVVQNSQEQIVRNVENTYLVDTDGLPKLKDDLHYDTEGQLELGRRFGQLLLPLIAGRN